MDTVIPLWCDDCHAPITWCGASYDDPGTRPATSGELAWWNKITR